MCHTVLMLILAIICFLAVVIVQSKVHWISIAGGILIVLLSNIPLLFVITYVMV